MTEMRYAAVLRVGDGHIMHFIQLINGLLILVYMMNRLFMKKDLIIPTSLLLLSYLMSSFLIILTV